MNVAHAPGGWLDHVIGASIEHRSVVVLAALGLAAAAVVVASAAPVEVLPEFVPPQVVLQTEAPGMGTAEVDERVTAPLERVLVGAPGMTAVRSTSTPGLSVVTLVFEEGTDVYRARQLVAERLQLARDRLPRAVPDPRIVPISSPIGALLRFAIASDDPDLVRAARATRAFADFVLAPRLLAVPGVAQVTANGGLVERVEVRPDPARLRDRGVTQDDLRAAVAASQAAEGAGFVDTGEARLDVYLDARLRAEDAAAALGEGVVAVRDGVPVRVLDVATVAAGDEPRVGAALYDGRPAVYVNVMKLPGADTRTVTAAVEEALSDLRGALPPLARIEPPVFRQGDLVDTAIRGVVRAMLLGAILIIFILVLFLRSPRLAVASLVAIPLSLLAALAVLVLAGASINTMTIGGLAIAVGEVTDDAIVDVENVWRRLSENARLVPPRPALDVVREACREVRGSVVHATVIVCLVLVPVLFLGGIAGSIFAPLAEAYMLAIIASLGVALTVTPALAASLFPGIATAGARPSLVARGLVSAYERIVRRVVRHPIVVLVLAGAAAAAALGAIPFIGGRLLPEFQERSLTGRVVAAPGTSLDETVRLAARVDAALRPAVASHVIASVGRAELDEDAAPVHQIELQFLLGPTGDREWEDVQADVARRIGSVPGVGFVVEEFLSERVHEVLSGEAAPVVVKVTGPEITALRRLAEETARVMQETPGLTGVRVEPQVDVPEIRLRPDREACARLGVRVEEAADDLVLWRVGETVGEIALPEGRTIDIAIAGAPADASLDRLPDLPISTRTLAPASLRDLFAIDRVDTAAVLRRDGGERRIAIGADAPGAGLSRAVADLERRLAAEVRPPPGYGVEVTGEAVERSRAALRLLAVGAIVGLGVLAILATAFRSLREALAVLANLPLGLIGGVAAALLAPEGLSVAGFVGFVTLLGIVSRNGIMLVTHLHRIEAERPGDDPVERVLRAAAERVIPITMTAAAAGLGLAPLALSVEAAGTEIEAPMALIVCGGLVTSTALNMLVLPTIYVWMARRRAQAAG